PSSAPSRTAAGRARWRAPGCSPRPSPGRAYASSSKPPSRPLQEQGKLVVPVECRRLVGGPLIPRRGRLRAREEGAGEVLDLRADVAPAPGRRDLRGAPHPCATHGQGDGRGERADRPPAEPRVCRARRGPCAQRVGGHPEDLLVPSGEAAKDTPEALPLLPAERCLLRRRTTGGMLGLHQLPAALPPPPPPPGSPPVPAGVDRDAREPALRRGRRSALLEEL